MTSTSQSGTRGRNPYVREIVIVDDDEALLIGHVRLLRRSGWRSVRGFLGPRGALRSISRRPCELVITNLELPGMTGLELAESLRARLDAERRPRLILLTEGVIPSEAREVFNAMFQKPVKSRELIEAVHRLLVGPDAEDRWEVG